MITNMYIKQSATLSRHHNWVSNDYVKTLQNINLLACMLPGIRHYILCARVMAVCLNDCDMVVLRFEKLVVR